MKVKNVILLAAIVMAACGSTACATVKKLDRPKPEKISPFLEKPDLLIPQKTEFPFHYFYLKQNAGIYENVYIAPVNTQYLRKNKAWASADAALAKSLGSDIDKIATYMRDEFKRAFATASMKNKLNVVDSPKYKKTLIVETAIVSIIPSKAELVILGTAANLLLPGASVIGNAAAAGSITIECMIRDSETKEIIAMYANTEKDQRAILNIAGMSWYTSAERNITIQAKNTAKVFSGKDYSDAKRRFIKIIAL